MKDLQQPSNQAIETGVTATVSTLKPQDESQSEMDTWMDALGEAMVAAGNRMDTDLEYRKYIQSITR